MDTDIIADLKQFITATISQQLSAVTNKEDLAHFVTKKDIVHLATKDDIASLSVQMKRLESKVDIIQSSIGDALSASNDTVDNQLTDHERRLTKLEAKTA